MLWPRQPKYRRDSETFNFHGERRGVGRLRRAVPRNKPTLVDGTVSLAPRINPYRFALIHSITRLCLLGRSISRQRKNRSKRFDERKLRRICAMCAVSRACAVVARRVANGMGFVSYGCKRLRIAECGFCALVVHCGLCHTM
jgi:hypothetical protein